MKNYFKFLNSKEPPSRLWGVGCAGVAVIVSSFVSLTLQDVARVDQHRVQQIEIMFDSMVQFQTFASAFASEISENSTVNASTRNRLIQNLNEQFARIRIIKQSVSDIDETSLNAYQEKISQMIYVSNQTHNVKSMKNFWSAASDLTFARNELNHQLKSAI